MKGKSADVVIVGAGAWGLAAAWGCLKHGLSVRVLEAETVAAKASGGVVGALSPHVPDQWNPKKQFQFEALDAGADYWAGIDAISGEQSGYGRIGRVIPILDQNQRDLSEARSENAKTLWQGRYHWEVRDELPNGLAAGAAPYGVISETLSGRLFPRFACASLAGAIRAQGGQIDENCVVLEIGDGWVRTAENEIHAKTVIVAHGVAGIEWIGAHMDKSAGGAVKGQAAVLDIDLGAMPQIFADGIYIVPQIHGVTTVGSTSENKWDHLDTDDQLDDIMARAVAIYPALQDANVIERWAGLRPKARRRDPMLGPIPGYTKTIAALGAFKIGLGLMPKISDLMGAYASGADIDLPDSFSVTHHLS